MEVMQGRLTMLEPNDGPLTTPALLVVNCVKYLFNLMKISFENSQANFKGLSGQKGCLKVKHFSALCS